MKSPLNFIDVCSGAGGLSTGLEMAGFRCLLGIDSDPQSIDTFALNHRYARVYNDDIRKLKMAELKSLIANRPIHLVVGGLPCQGFSTVGIGDPKDKRNSLFLHFSILFSVGLLGSISYSILLEKMRK